MTIKNQEIRDKFSIYNLNGIIVIIGVNGHKTPILVQEYILTGRKKDGDRPELAYTLLLMINCTGKSTASITHHST
jgi:hypothetical protein